MPTIPDPAEVAKPAVAPVEEPFQLLRDKLTELNYDPEHPLGEEPEPVVVPTVVAPTPVAPVAPVIQQLSLPTVLAHPQELLDAARSLGVEDRYLAPGVVKTQELLDYVVKARLNAVQQPPQAKPAEEDDDAVIDYLENEIGADRKLTAWMRKKEKELKELKSRAAPEEVVQKALSQRDQSRAGERAVEAAIVSLGPKFEKLVGKGSLRDMDDGPDKAKRMHFFKASGVDFAKDSAQTIRQKIVAAANVFGDLLTDPVPTPAAAPNPYEAPAKPPVLMSKEEWDRASLGRPSSMKPKASKGEKAAADHIREYMREHEISVNGDRDELEGIPG